MPRAGGGIDASELSIHFHDQLTGYQIAELNMTRNFNFQR
jgi:hypothetical protein